MVTAAKLIEAVERLGVRFELDGEKLCAVPGGRLSDDLRRAIGERKAEIVAMLRDRLRAEASAQGPKTSPGGKLCRACRTIGRCFGDERRGYVCPSCAEWRVAGCARFTVARSNDASTPGTIACLCCGGSWLLHGSPPTDAWRILERPEDAPLVTARFTVLAAAALAIAKCGR